MAAWLAVAVICAFRRRVRPPVRPVNAVCVHATATRARRCAVILPWDGAARRQGLAFNKKNLVSLHLGIQMILSSYITLVSNEVGSELSDSNYCFTRSKLVAEQSDPNCLPCQPLRGEGVSSISLKHKGCRDLKTNLHSGWNIPSSQVLGRYGVQIGIWEN